MTIIEKYNNAKESSPDMGVFMDILFVYASQYKHITEFGVRWIVSTWALLSGRPERMISYDINHPKVHGASIEEVYELAAEQGTKYDFVLASTLDVVIDETEMLFIDTLHEHDHLIVELSLHSCKVKDRIICHDSIAFPGVASAIKEFMAEQDGRWVIEKDYDIWPGLTVLKRTR